MSNETAINKDLEQHKFLTTVGRKTGSPHRIEIWFTAHDDRIYLISGGGTRSDWVKNLQVDPNVEFEVGAHRWRGTAKTVDTPEHPARALLATRYQNWTRSAADQLGNHGACGRDNRRRRLVNTNTLAANVTY